jgi:hypothetical protein
MSHLSVRVAVRYMAAQESLLESAHKITREALKEIDDSLKSLKEWLDYAEPAHRLLEIRDPKATLDDFFRYQRILGVVARNLKKLEREQDLSRILKAFDREADTLWAWVEEGFPTIDRILEYFWNSRVGQKLADKMILVQESPQMMRTFYDEHK